MKLGPGHWRLDSGRLDGLFRCRLYPTRATTPQRLAILGASGAGKTWWAARLGQRLGLPVHHLDQLFWQAGWQAPVPDQWYAQVDALYREPAWIIEGNYPGSLDRSLGRADLILFLDLPTHARLRAVLLRYWRHRQGPTRPELHPNCPERLTLGLLRRTSTFHWRRRPALLRRLAATGPATKVLILRSHAQVQQWVDSLPSSPP